MAYNPAKRRSASFGLLWTAMPGGLESAEALACDVIERAWLDLGSISAPLAEESAASITGGGLDDWLDLLPLPVAAEARIRTALQTRARQILERRARRPACARRRAAP